MLYRLDGHFSYIDKFNHLKFTFTADREETYRKLQQMTSADATYKPFGRDEFTVSMPKSLQIGDDIRALIGLDCVIYVRPIRYNFTSRLPKNKGEKVSGVSLILDDIHKSAGYD